MRRLKKGMSPMPVDKKNDRALQQTEVHFRLLVEGILDYGIFMMDLTGHIVSWNTGAERIKGYKASEIIGEHFSKFYPPEDNAWGKPAYELKQAIIHGRFEDEGWRLRKDGSRFWANVIITALYNSNKEHVGFGKVTRDLSERRKTELELQESREQLINLSARLQVVREEERAQLSREIHDELGGILTALKMDISQIRRRVDPQDGLLLSKLTSFSELVDHTIKTVRKIATELRPGILDDFGLVAAIEWQLADFEGRSSLRCFFETTTDRVELSRDGLITVFRIFQETLTNIARHANASEVHVNISTTEDCMILKVHDNGMGIESDRLQGGKSLGLLGMRERARLINSKLTIEGRPGEGTTVLLEVPMVKSSR
jgi:PAS domain S-box-containing protein